MYRTRPNREPVTDGTEIKFQNRTTYPPTRFKTLTFRSPAITLLFPTACRYVRAYSIIICTLYPSFAPLLLVRARTPRYVYAYICIVIVIIPRALTCRAVNAIDTKRTVYGIVYTCIYVYRDIDKRSGRLARARKLSAG